jgi:hypothetical protein
LAPEYYSPLTELIESLYCLAIPNSKTAARVFSA